jgi:hypothetical protein
MKHDAPADLLGTADRLLRPRLLTRVDALLRPPARALWIGAGPGMGKSTLARQLLSRRGAATLHLSLDASCADGAAFADLLAERLAGRLAGAPRPVAHDTPQLPASACQPLALPALGPGARWHRLWAACDAGAWIVLDDLQRAGSDAALATWLPGAIEALRADQRLLLVSRRAPPAALARLQLEGLLARLPAVELGFDESEREAWCPGAAAGLAAWPAALSRHATGPAGQIDPTLLQQLVASEVLPELDAGERALLACLAWLPDGIDREAAARLGGDAEAGARLDALAERGLLVERSTGGRWRLHDLLAQALRRVDDGVWQRTLAELEARGTPEAADSAIALALAAAEAGAGTNGASGNTAWAGADRLLVAHAPRWLAACRHRSLAEQCARLPPAQRSAALWAALAAACAPLDPRAARTAAAHALQAAPETALGLRAAALTLVIASYFQTFDSTEPLSHWLAQLEQLAQFERLASQSPIRAGIEPTPEPEPEPERERDRETRAERTPGRQAGRAAEAHAGLTPEAQAGLAIATFSALFLREPSHPALPRWHAEVRALPAAPIDPNLRLRATMLLAKQAWYTAAQAEAALLADAARGALDDTRCTPYSRLLWGLTQQYRAWARAEPAAGRVAGAEALSVARASGVHGLDRHLRLHDACFAKLLGRDDEARSQFEAAAAQADAGRRMEAWHLFSVQAWLALEDGELALADEAVRRAIDAGAAMGPAPQAMSWAIAGQIALADGREAHEALAALELAAGRDGNARAAIWARWIEAGAAHTRGDGPAAERQLDAALGAMRRAGGGLWFGLHRPLAARLGALALARGVQPRAAQQLVRQHGLTAPPGADASWPWAVRITHHSRPEMLTIEVSGQPVALGAKLPRRPLELLQALIDAGGRATAARLADDLWPEAEGDRAMDAFEVALRRARALLGQGEALVLAGGVLSFDRSRVWTESGAAAPSRPVGPSGHSGATGAAASLV